MRGAWMKRACIAVLAAALSPAGAGAPPARAADRALDHMLAAVGSGGGTPGAESEARPSDPPSPSRAFFLSLLLPGLGQRANGDRGKMEFFLAAEATVWATSATFHFIGEMREDDYREFAAIRAGAEGSEGSEDYYQLLSDYDSSDDYNIDIRREARLIFADRQDQLRYIAENSILDARDWQWNSPEERRQFQLLRHDALSAKRTALLATGWAVVNRVVSSIEAARTAQKRRHAAREEAQAPPGADPARDDGPGRPYSVSVGLVPVSGELAPGLAVGRRF